MLCVVLKAAPYKIAVVRPPTSHFTNRPSNTNKTCWRNKDEILSDVLLWNPIHEHTRVGRQALNRYWVPSWRLDNIDRGELREFKKSILSRRLDDYDELWCKSTVTRQVVKSEYLTLQDELAKNAVWKAPNSVVRIFWIDCCKSDYRIRSFVLTKGNISLLFIDP